MALAVLPCYEPALLLASKAQSYCLSACEMPGYSIPYTLRTVDSNPAPYAVFGSRDFPADETEFTGRMPWLMMSGPIPEQMYAPRRQVPSHLSEYAQSADISVNTRIRLWQQFFLIPRLI